MLREQDSGTALLTRKSVGTPSNLGFPPFGFMINLFLFINRLPSIVSWSSVRGGLGGQHGNASMPRHPLRSTRAVITLSREYHEYKSGW